MSKKFLTLENTVINIDHIVSFYLYTGEIVLSDGSILKINGNEAIEALQRILESLQ